MPRNAEDPAGSTVRSTSGASRHVPITLISRLVRYEGGPDRRTIYPPGLSDDARMATWLSADNDAFVDLERCR